VYSQSLKAAETLHQESSISNEACEVITQAIAEWTYHKIIDLMNGDVPEIFHERILKKVNETIYDFLIDENRQRPLTYETFQEPDVRDVLEMLIKDTYRDALAQLYSDKGICKDVYTWALSQSHCDDKPDDEKPLEDVLSSVFKSSSVLSRLFILGKKLQNPTNLGPAKEAEVFEGKYNPTYFTIIGKKSGAEPVYTRDAQLERKFRVAILSTLRIMFVRLRGWKRNRKLFS